MASPQVDPDEALRKGPEYPFSKDIPMEYTHWIEEQKSWRETCGLTNMTYMLYLHVEGPDAISLFSETSINSFAEFSVGSAKHAVQCNDRGKVISEGLVLRLGENEFVTQGFPAAYLSHFAQVEGYEVTTQTRDTHVFELEGPAALPVMESITDYPLRELAFLHFDTIELAGRDVILLRHGMSGHIGFELHVEPDGVEDVKEALMTAGGEHGIRRVGMRAALTRAIESGQPQGNLQYLPALFKERIPSVFSVMGSFDADEVSGWYRSPIELGWSHYVAFDHDYVGRDALEGEVDDPTRTLVTLVWESEDVDDISHSLQTDGDTYKQIRMPTKDTVGVNADEVRADGQLVGTSSYPNYVYPLREMLSLSTIDITYSDPGTEVSITWGEGRNPLNPMVEDHVPKAVTATVAPAPYADEMRRSEW